MEIIEVMRKRHSVRQYEDIRIREADREILNAYAKKLNEEGHLHMQIIYDEPKCFSSRLAHYGNFENVKNYIVVAGRRSKDLEERAGYYGELLVLKAQEIGLNTCFVALTHGKSAAVLSKDEKEVIVIALGYGKTMGREHKNKEIASIARDYDLAPEWYRRGVDAAMLAPTAVNQQKFRFTLEEGNRVKAQLQGLGPCLRIDLGIVKCHFELGAGKENFEWV
jgi:nitroreductase